MEYVKFVANPLPMSSDNLVARVANRFLSLSGDTYVHRREDPKEYPRTYLLLYEEDNNNVKQDLVNTYAIFPDQMAAAFNWLVSGDKSHLSIFPKDYYESEESS